VILPETDGRRSTECTFEGDRGESTVSNGGDAVAADIIDTGREDGPFGRGFRGLTAADCGWNCPKTFDPSSFVFPSPPDVLGCTSFPGAERFSGGCRGMMADFGAASLSWPRFSNFDRNDEKGLIEDVSGPSFPSDILPFFPSYTQSSFDGQGRNEAGWDDIIPSIGSRTGNSWVYRML